MKGENGVPPTADWTPEPKPWDAKACCPVDCTDPATKTRFLCDGEGHIIRGDN